MDRMEIVKRFIQKKASEYYIKREQQIPWVEIGNRTEYNIYDDVLNMLDKLEMFIFREDISDFNIKDLQ